MKVLVTGAAGFVGFHLSRRLLEMGYDVVGIDSVNDYYDPALKKARLNILQDHDHFQFEKIDLVERGALERCFQQHVFQRVLHMAAQAGVRYSLENPYAYVQSNLVGFINILECCRHAKTPHFIYASSSSVYGLNRKMPFSVRDNVDHPISLYAATKKSNELTAHVYSALYSLPTTGLRFFTVYGPWGRPDMALFKFTKAILSGEEIEVYNEGKMKRDFTYIDDVVEGIIRVAEKIPTKDSSGNRTESHPGTSSAPYRVYNVGNHSSVELLDFIGAIEEAVGKKAKMRMLPMQQGDVPETYADVDDLVRDVGFQPSTPIREGVNKFVSWYREYTHQ